MIVTPYEYKDHLNLPGRLAIAQTYTRLGGYHGLVTELAVDYQTNRQQIYAILSDVEEGFAPQLPGPKSPDESPLVQRIATLDATNRLLAQENEQLHRRLQQSVEVTPERLERLLLTGIGEMLPDEPLQTMVKVAYRPEFVPSVGHLSGLVNHTGTIAGLILNDERVTSVFQAAACDGIFFHQQPILTVVEPETMAIGAIEKMGDRTANS